MKATILVIAGLMAGQCFCAPADGVAASVASVACENVRDDDLGDLVKVTAVHSLTKRDVASKKYACRFVFRNANGDTVERWPDVFGGGSATVTLDAADLAAGAGEIACVIRESKKGGRELARAKASVTPVANPSVVRDAPRRTREAKPGEPVIVRLGTTAVGEVESNPAVFKGVPYVFEHARWGSLRIRRYPDLAVMAPTLRCSLQMPCTFVANDRLYVTGTRGDRKDVHGTYLIESDDMKTWTPAREIVSNLTRIAYNTTMTKADGRYVLATERAPGKDEKCTNGGYQMTFAESTDLKTWTVIPGTAYVDNSGSPCLKYHGGWFYFFSLTGSGSTPEGNPVYSMQVARSRDLKAWTVAKKLVLDPVHEDRRPYPGARFTAAELVKMQSAEDRNASDIDMCEVGGDLLITYSWGNQLGDEFLALAIVKGWSERAFCESFFR